MNTASTSPRLLVVDDEPDLRTLYEMTLLREGYEVETASCIEDALARLSESRYALLITDMRMPDGTGLDLLAYLERGARSEKAIVITAFGSAENAVEALKAGAYDYLTKPVDLKQFRAAVASALGRSPDTPARAAANRSAAAAPASTETRRLSGSSAAMHEVRTLVDKVARSMAPVLVQGESGTGKELVARAIHRASTRHDQPFIAVNCGAIPDNLLEAEFFGYRKGAFTGAQEDREGFFQAAQGGTLFLDEIGDLPLAMQSKLLRAIQERAVRAIGAINEVQVNVRVLSASHKDLASEVQASRFRQDLFYRLNVIQIRVPPLRERLDDLPEICNALLARIAADAGQTGAPLLAPDALQRLARYSFPGNVRELENLLHRALAMSNSDVIAVNDLGLPDEALDTGLGDADALVGMPSASPVPAGLPHSLESHLDAVERDILVRALDAHGFNRTAAGQSLGLSLRQMRYRMARLGIRGGDDGEVA